MYVFFENLVMMQVEWLLLIMTNDDRYQNVMIKTCALIRIYMYVAAFVVVFIFHYIM